MTRKCSHCGNNGHNSRTCPNRGGVKLFGVRLTDGPIRKSASMGNLMMMSNPSSPADPSEPASAAAAAAAAAASGYLSDGLVEASTSSNSRERKKGVPWTEEEHRMFLLGLQKLGKGDWRGIARNFVITRTPTQVASHAQKYFIRQSNMTRKKRRSSLFDMTPDPSSTAVSVEDYPKVASIDPICDSSVQNQILPTGHSVCDNSSQNQMLPTGHTGCDSSVQNQMLPTDLNSVFNQGPLVEPNNGAPLSSQPASDQEFESNYSEKTAEAENSFSQCAAAMACGVPMTFPGFMAPLLPFPFPVWPGFRPATTELPPNSNIFKPRAEIPKAPVNIIEETGISKLSIGDPPGSIEPSGLSLKLLNKPSRQSAFHTNPALNDNGFSSSGNAIHVV